ncbi:MAG: phosphopyruvate hydratase [Flavobacteriales bacterium]|nr:phosphopyruvate hydratase [Flavobacteriales bacterium]
MDKIIKIFARAILDSRGNPTVEVDLFSKNEMARASVPSGASTGKHEAFEIRDGGRRYMGKGVQKSVNNINKILSKELIGLNVFDQRKIDNLMINIDGTENKSNLGANSILPISIAASKLAAKINNQQLFEYLSLFNSNSQFTLPLPLMNILNGGAHADNKVDIQEFMIIPIGNDFRESLRIGVEIFHNLRQVLKEKGYSTNVGDEGGFAPNLSSNEEALDLILNSINKSGYSAGENVFLAIDAAASEFYENKTYTFSNGKKLSSTEMVDFWIDLVNKFPIISIEDAFHEDDWDSWSLLTKKIGEKIQLVGDDLFVTNCNRLQRGIIDKSANSILIKVNQIGTLSETIDCINLAHKNNFSTIMSHRSGETEDNYIADLSVAFSCGQIKTGSSSRSDRVSKYNQLLRIEEKLASNAIFLGKNTNIIKRWKD